MRFASLFAAALLLATAGAAIAKDATCFTTDDGEYPCQFVSTGSDGSFDISAPAKPSFSLVMDSPGVATVFATYEDGGRPVALPGSYRRSTIDPACWDNAETATQICAW